MRYIQDLTPETLKLLELIYQRSKFYQVRQRARGTDVSKKTIKRILKFLKMKWCRIKKVVGGEPIAEFYEKKVKELEELKRREEREERGEIEIRYGDESGFCLIPYVPYALARVLGKNRNKKPTKFSTKCFRISE